MPNFTFTTGIPNGAFSPAQNRPTMTVNNDSNSAIWSDPAVDHYGFNNNNGGLHQKVTFPLSVSDPTLSSNTTQIYPKTFGSGVTYLETYGALKTSAATQINGYVPFVKAMVQFTVPSGNGACSLNTSNTLAVNVSSVTRSANSFTVNFTQALPYATYQVFFSTLLEIGGNNFSYGIPSGGRLQASFTFLATQGVFSGGELIGIMVI